MSDFSTIGDLARQLVQRRQNAETRAQMDALIGEVGSGRKADLAESLRGDFTLLASLERDIAALASYRIAASELQGRTGATQRVLETVASVSGDLAANLIEVNGAQSPAPETLAGKARQAFGTAVASLNTSFGGQSLLSGTATNEPALEQADTMLAALESVIAPLTDAAAVETAVRAWFAPGGDFDTVGYLGSTTPIPDQPVAPGLREGLGVLGSDPALRDTLTGLALAALADRPPLAGQVTQQTQLLRSGADTLLQSQDRLAALRGEVGRVEESMDRVLTRNAAETSALTLGRGALTDADIFESAAELEAVQGQLELLYAITARSARLTLVGAL